MPNSTLLVSALGGAAVLLLALPAGAIAQTAAPATSATANQTLTRASLSQRLDAEFKAIDTNGDASLSKAEIDSAIAKSASEAEARLKQRQKDEFGKLDANKDGQLSLAEYQAGASIKMREGAGQAKIQQFDSNKDGKVTATEYRAPTLAQFDRFDRNKDGVLSTAEQQPASAPRK